MNWLGLAFGLAIVTIIVILIDQKRKRQKKIGFKKIPLFGFTLLMYRPDQMNAIEAERFGLKLQQIKERAWPRLEAIYDGSIDCGLETVRLDTEFSSDATHKGVHFIREVIEMVMGGGSAHITMRPAGGRRHRGEFWFALELHNLYRAQAFGMNKVYLSDYEHTQAEIDLWDQAQDACAGAAVP